MYLVELIFDSQCLRIYAAENQDSEMTPLEQLGRLWNESSEKKKIMTSKVIQWIAQNLQTLSKQDRQQLIKEVSECIRIERDALELLQAWLIYQKDKEFRFFAQYAALKLFVAGSSDPRLSDIIDGMLSTDDDFNRLKSSIESLIMDPYANRRTICQILSRLHNNIYRASRFSVHISSIELFQVFLELEIERVSSKAVKHRSFLSMAKGCSSDIKDHLLKHFQTYLDVRLDLDATVKDEFFANVVKWMTDELDPVNEIDSFLRELFIYLIPFSYNHRFPLVCKVIVAVLNHVYISFQTTEDSVLLEDEVITHLEKLFASWLSYADDVVALCLLAYGNCLTRLHGFQMSRDVSTETMDVLTELSASASSEVISIRATFC